MKALRPLILLAVALLLPSCVQWSIGENIRESAQRRLAVDTEHRFRCEGVTLVPEVRYRSSHRVVDIAIPEGTQAWPTDHEYTGRYRVLKEGRRRWDVEPGELYDTTGKTLHPMPPRRRSTYYLPNIRIAPVIEGGRETRVEGLDLANVCDAAGEIVVEKHAAYGLAKAASVPFEYLIDPVLSVVSTPFAVVGIYAMMLEQGLEELGLD